MRKPLAVALVVIIVIVGGIACATAFKTYTTFERTGVVRPDARPDDCEFAVFTAHPDMPSEEIGVITFIHGGYPKEIEVVRPRIAHDVCASGGNAVVLWMNGFGQFIKGTVLYLHPPKPAPAPSNNSGA
jgi:hypothetical protein